MTLGLSISRSIFISREREFLKHFRYFPGISRELKSYLEANQEYPIFEIRAFKLTRGENRSLV